MGGCNSACQERNRINNCIRATRETGHYCRREYPLDEVLAAQARTRASEQAAISSKNATDVNLQLQQETNRRLRKEQSNSVMQAEYTDLLYKKIEQLKEEEETRRRLNENAKWTFEIDPLIENEMTQSILEDLFVTAMIDQTGLDEAYFKTDKDPPAFSTNDLQVYRKPAAKVTLYKFLEPYTSVQRLFLGHMDNGLSMIGNHPWISKKWMYFVYDNTLFKIRAL